VTLEPPCTVTGRWRSWTIYLIENKLPHALSRIVIDEIEQAKDELRKIFDYLYKKEGRLDK
jgi:hypothetical protein